MDVGAINESIPLYLKGLKVTLVLGLAGIISALLIGFLIALIRYFEIPYLNPVTKAYIELSRNTPLLIQLFFLYYGLPKVGIPIGKYTAAIIGLSFLGGAYMAETLRASFEYVPTVQIESGKSLGFDAFQLTTLVILPQGLPLSIPSVGANCIFLLKETSVFSAISIMDLTNVTKDLIGMYYLTKEFLLMLVISYMILILPLVVIVYWLERRARVANAGL